MLNKKPNEQKEITIIHTIQTTQVLKFDGNVTDNMIEKAVQKAQAKLMAALDKNVDDFQITGTKTFPNMKDDDNKI